MAAATNCTLCQKGAYSTNLGAPVSALCALCAPGTYGTGSGMPAQANCLNCLPGQYSGMGSTSCAYCASGFTLLPA